jgi:hypothetical protein
VAVSSRHGSGGDASPFFVLHLPCFVFLFFFFSRAPVAIDSLFFLLSENSLQEHRTDCKPNLDLCPCSVPLSVVLPQVYSITLQFHCLRISNIQHPSVGARGQNWGSHYPRHAILEFSVSQTQYQGACVHIILNYFCALSSADMELQRFSTTHAYADRARWGSA